MQQILKFTGLFFLITLFSCEDLVYKEYKLHARNFKEDIELNQILSEEGIYKQKMDSSMHTLSFMYSQRQTDLAKLNAFLEDNNLLNRDTTSEVFDSSYLYVDEQNAILDSLDRIDSIRIADELKKQLEEKERQRVDSIAKAIKRQDSIKAINDTVVAPVLDMIDVF